MSTTRTTEPTLLRRGLRFAAVGAGLVFALMGGLASASAQSAGGGRGGGSDGGPGGNSGGGSAVIVYGTPGNCPPTVACGGPEVHRPKVRWVKPSELCGDHFPDGRLHRRCMARY